MLQDMMSGSTYLACTINIYLMNKMLYNKIRLEMRNQLIILLMLRDMIVKRYIEEI